MADAVTASELIWTTRSDSTLAVDRGPTMAEQLRKWCLTNDQVVINADSRLVVAISWSSPGIRNNLPWRRSWSAQRAP
ncbi:hypothetical protein LV779_31870 [Streptomyces thinghirensis]|nr:hypothetical protein [Streptomyces thinghirensis]